MIYDMIFCMSWELKHSIEVIFMKRTWKDKLTSRKFWAAVVGVVISVMVAFGADNDAQQKTVGVITASATLIAYIVGEGLTDAAHKDDEK